MVRIFLGENDEAEAAIRAALNGLARGGRPAGRGLGPAAPGLDLVRRGSRRRGREPTHPHRPTPSPRSATSAAWVGRFGLLAYVCFIQGDLARADELGQQVLIEARERGDRWGEGMMLLLGSACAAGRAAPSRRSSTPARPTPCSHAIGDRFGQAQALTTLGRTLVAGGSGRRRARPCCSDALDDSLADPDSKDRSHAGHRPGRRRGGRRRSRDGARGLRPGARRTTLSGMGVGLGAGALEREVAQAPGPAAVGPRRPGRRPAAAHAAAGDPEAAAVALRPELAGPGPGGRRANDEVASSWAAQVVAADPRPPISTGPWPRWPPAWLRPETATTPALPTTWPRRSTPSTPPTTCVAQAVVRLAQAALPSTRWAPPRPPVGGRRRPSDRLARARDGRPRAGARSSASALARRRRPSSDGRARGRPARGQGRSAGLRDRAQVGLDRGERAELLLGLLVGHGGDDDDVLAGLPVGRGGHLVLGRELQRVDDPEDLVEVAPGAGRVGEGQLDLVVRRR